MDWRIFLYISFANTIVIGNFMNDISTKQNLQSMIDLLKAQRIAYSKCKHYQIFDTVSILIAIITPIVGFANNSSLDVLTVIGVIWTILYLVFDTIRKSKLSIGAKIQEQFDTELYDMQWNNTLCREKISVDNITEFANEYQNNDLHNWYSQEITTDLDKNIAVILCQRINLSWENTLKYKFSKALLICVILYYAIFFVIVISINYGIYDTMKILSPTIPFLVYGVQNFYNVKSQRDTKKNLIQDIDREFMNYSNTKILPSDTMLRNIQDVIYNERNSIEKTPDWFYKIYKQKFENHTDEVIRNLKNSL